VISFLSTTLPSPALHCRLPSDGGTLDLAAPLIGGIADVFGVFDSENGCGDLIFSGHTLFFVLSLLITITYNRLRFVRRALQLGVLAVCLPMFAASTVATQRHYSVDVVLACGISSMLWLCTESVVHDLHARSPRLPLHDSDCEHERETPSRSSPVELFIL
jgi:hypothetical protein